MADGGLGSLGNDFQRACLTQLGIGQVMVLSQQLASINEQISRAEFKRVRRHIRHIEAAVLAHVRGNVIELSSTFRRTLLIFFDGLLSKFR